VPSGKVRHQRLEANGRKRELAREAERKYEWTCDENYSGCV